jgi:hypothetical protein
MLILILYTLFFGAVTAFAANSRHRDPMYWLWVGIVFGVFGLITVLVMGEESDEEDNDWHRSSIAQSLQMEAANKFSDCAEEIKEEAPDDLSEPSQCMSCGKVIPKGLDHCHYCGWTYKESMKEE